MNITFDQTKNSMLVEASNGNTFYAELTDFADHFRPLILDEVRLYTASDYALWVAKDRKRVSTGEAGGQTFEPQEGCYEVVGNRNYVSFQLEEWKTLYT